MDHGDNFAGLAQGRLVSTLRFLTREESHRWPARSKCKQLIIKVIIRNEEGGWTLVSGECAGMKRIRDVGYPLFESDATGIGGEARIIGVHREIRQVSWHARAVPMKGLPRGTGVQYTFAPDDQSSSPQFGTPGSHWLQAFAPFSDRRLRCARVVVCGPGISQVSRAMAAVGSLSGR